MVKKWLVWAAGNQQKPPGKDVTLNSKRLVLDFGIFHNQARGHSLCSLEIPRVCSHSPLPAWSSSVCTGTQQQCGLSELSGSCLLGFGPWTAMHWAKRIYPRSLWGLLWRLRFRGVVIAQNVWRMELRQAKALLPKDLITGFQFIYITNVYWTLPLCWRWKVKLNMYPGMFLTEGEKSTS